jgi:hypothetical protein
MTTATHAVRPRAAPPQTRRMHDVGAVRAMGSPRYLSASLKLGGVHDPEEHEAEHAAGVVASGGCYKVKDPGGSDHLRAEADPKRVRSAPTPRVVDPGAEGRVRRAVAPTVTDPGAAGRVRRAMAERLHDPGGSASLRAMHAREAVRGAASAMLPPLRHDVVDSGAASRIEHARAGIARPLAPTVRARLEHGFGESMENVRVHTGPAAHAATAGVYARAYTEGERITLGDGESEHDVRLLAHEATHVVQNRRAAGVPRRDPAHETRREPTTTARREVRAESTSARMASGPIRRLGLDTILNALADLANMIPGFRLFTIILGVNPINWEKVERSGANILRGAVELIPGGGLIVKALEQYGIFEKGGAFVDEQISSLGMTGAAIRDALMEFLDSLGWRDILHPGDVWDRAKRIFTEPIDRIIAFFKALAAGIIAIVKEAILKPLAGLVAKTRAWDLLIALLGKNPITGEEVAQTPDALIGGFMKLIGQEEVWQNIKKANAIGRAFAWFKKAMASLLAFAMELPGLFLNVLKSFVIEDLLDLPGAVGRVLGVFGDFAGRFFSWALEAVFNLLEIVFDVVSPGAFAYVKKTGAALKSILKNPLPFVHNLVRAAKLGLNNFADHFGEHLKRGLIDWLTGSLPGVYIPKALTLPELGKFALSVLGISWAQIRGKIVKALGPNGERIMQGLETAFDIVVALVSGGPAAAWELIKEKLTNLKDMVIEGIQSFVIDTIVKKAIPKLIAMFIPGAGFISAILSIYDTVMVFVQKLAKIAAAIKAFVDSIIAIAAGQIEAAANRVEAALGGLVSLAISFLAGFLGLGNIASKVMEVIGKVRGFVDKALDAVIGWIVGKAKGLLAKLFGKGEPKDVRTDEQKSADLRKGVSEAKALLANPTLSLTDVRKQLPGIKTKYRMAVLEVVRDSAAGVKETDHIHGAINPELNSEQIEKAREDQLETLSAYVSARLFAHEELVVDNLANPTDARAMIDHGLAKKKLFELKPRGPRDPHTTISLYSFDATKADRSTYGNKRNDYGFDNSYIPAAAEVSILNKGLDLGSLPNAPTAQERNTLRWHVTSGRYQCVRTKVGGLTYAEVSLGHEGGEGASEYWNRLGHTQTYAQNLAWNKDPNSYWGPEKSGASAGSGTAAPLFRIPAKFFGSHEMWQ